MKKLQKGKESLIKTLVIILPVLLLYIWADYVVAEKLLLFILGILLGAFRSPFIKRRYKKDREKREELIEELKEQNQEESRQFNSVIDTLDEFLKFSINSIEEDVYDKEVYLKKIFHMAFDMVEEAEFGSAYIIKENKVVFIDSIGYKLENLLKLDNDFEMFRFNSCKVIIDRNPYKRIKYMMKSSKVEEDRKIYELKECLHVGIAVSDSLIGGFSLDIAMDSEGSFANSSLERLGAMQKIINSYFETRLHDEELMSFHHDLVRIFLHTLELHDDYTKNHSDEVAKYSVEIGKKLGLNKKELSDLYWAALLHDIGKVIIPANILNKNGRLTDQEFDLIKSHPAVAYKVLSKSPKSKEIARYVLFHHERWDGRGYPNGLKGEEIPLLSQIITVADSWHAMISKRAYKDKLSRVEAIEEIRRNRGTQFAPKVAEAFLEII